MGATPGWDASPRQVSYRSAATPPQDTLFGRTIPYSHMERAAAAAAKEKTVMVSCSKAQHNDPAASKTAQPGVQIKSQNNIKASKTRRL